MTMRRTSNPDGSLVLDFGDVDCIWSVGPRLSSRLAKEVKRALVKTTIAIQNNTMMKRFQISRYDQMFPIHVRMDTAIAD